MRLISYGQTNMLKLDLNKRHAVKLPASEFPDRADVYVCDECGRDITKHFQPGRAHVWSPMGVERYSCLCGQKYLTGATEWDHFRDSERKKRIVQTLGVGISLSILLSVVALLFYLPLHLILGLPSVVLTTALVIAALPFLWMQIMFWPGVIKSVWRTRVATSLQKTGTK